MADQILTNEIKLDEVLPAVVQKPAAYGAFGFTASEVGGIIPNSLSLGSGLSLNDNSNNAAVTVTGTTAETTIKTITLKKAVLGPNGRVKIWFIWESSGAGGTKTLKLKFGATAVVTGTIAAGAVRGWAVMDVVNQNSVSTQIGVGSIFTDAPALNTITVTGPGINTDAADTDITATVALAVGTDSFIGDALFGELVRL